MRVQLEESVSVTARMMPILEGVAEREPAQCEGTPHEHGGWSTLAVCTGRGRRAGEGLLRRLGVRG